MDIETIKADWPDVDLARLLPLFPEIPMSEYPELEGYTREDVYSGAMAPGGLFLASDMARALELPEGMRVLDLGPGNGASSVFLAREFKVNVTALEHWVDPERIRMRAEKAGVGELVSPVEGDARDMPFEEESFDAVFSLDAFAYFMGDDAYPAYLARFVRDRGRACIGGHAFTSELNEDTPEEFLWDMAHAYHSPPWWRNHFEKSGSWRVLSCGEHPRGRAFWLDDVRRNLEECHPRDMDEDQRQDILHSVVMLLGDTEGFVSHFTLVAEKTGLG